MSPGSTGGGTWSFSFYSPGLQKSRIVDFKDGKNPTVRPKDSNGLVVLTPGGANTDTSSLTRMEPIEGEFIDSAAVIDKIRAICAKSGRALPADDVLELHLLSGIPIHLSEMTEPTCIWMVRLRNEGSLYVLRASDGHLLIAY